MDRRRVVVDRQIEEYIALVGRQLAEREWRFVAIPRYGGAFDMDPWFTEERERLARDRTEYEQASAR
jgi:hypothetical protein